MFIEIELFATTTNNSTTSVEQLGQVHNLYGKDEREKGSFRLTYKVSFGSEFGTGKSFRLSK